ncbi:hypothetical protein IWW50_001456 [Coemansia erecta]|nr:hypothetical protein IWW50_001456 [Coemansia erecta]
MPQNVPISGNSKKQEGGQFPAANASYGGRTPGADAGSFSAAPGTLAPPNSYANPQGLPMQGRQGWQSFVSAGTAAPPNSFANPSLGIPMQGQQGFGNTGTDAPPNSYVSQNLGIPMQGFGNAGTNAPPNSYANPQSIGGAAGISNSFLDRKLRGMDIVHEREEKPEDGEDDEMSGTSPSSRSANRPPYNESGDIFEMD